MSRVLTVVKFGAFVLVMSLLTAALFAVFSRSHTGSAAEYSATFTDVSGLKPGDSVRIAGVEIGTVDDVSLDDDNTVSVEFGVERRLILTSGTKAAVRYLNLVGDRYLELLDGPGDTRVLPSGSRIPASRTMPALDLDVLLGGLKPVVQGLEPKDVNQLTAALIDIMQGQGGTLDSLFSRTSSFTRALADNSEVLQQLIDNLNGAMSTLAADGGRFEGAIDRLHRLVGELAQDREPIGAAVESLSRGTASLAGLLGSARSPLAGTVDQLNRLAPNVDGQKDLIDAVLQRSPENYRKLARMGSYGSFFNYYLCGVTFRVTDLQKRTAVFPWFKQDTGRCAEQP